MPSLSRPIRLLTVASVVLAVVAPASTSGAFDPAPTPPPRPAVERSVPAAPAAAAPVLHPLGAAAGATESAFSPSAASAARAAAERASARGAPPAGREAKASFHRPTASGRATSHATSHPAAPVRFRGTNHVWIPSLGIDRSVAWFPCSRSTPPGLAVYRWGCAGANNVYLFAHAYAAFEPLHDAYVSGRLRKGLEVVYADGAGRIHRYAVAWWRLTTPDHGEFAYAAQSRPSLTLQTCVGARSQYRLIVRLLEVG